MLGFRPDVEVLLENFDNGQMVSYNLSTHEVKEYKPLCDRLELSSLERQVFPCAESLIFS